MTSTSGSQNTLDTLMVAFLDTSQSTTAKSPHTIVTLERNSKDRINLSEIASAFAGILNG